MKLERISPHIWRLGAWALVPVNVWLVAAVEGLTLVDAGLPFMARGIAGAVSSLGVGPLQRVLLTHGHPDHVGGIEPLWQKAAISLYAHERELPYLEGRRPYPGRRRAAPGFPRGWIEPLVTAGDGKLAPVAGLEPYFTPGHSPGHVVYYHRQDDVLLAGDLFTSRRGQLRPPMAMFTADMAQALASGGIIAQLRPGRVEVSHGGPVLHPAEHPRRLP